MLDGAGFSCELSGNGALAILAFGGGQRGKASEPASIERNNDNNIDDRYLGLEVVVYLRSIFINFF